MVVGNSQEEDCQEEGIVREVDIGLGEGIGPEGGTDLEEDTSPEEGSLQEDIVLAVGTGQGVGIGRAEGTDPEEEDIIPEGVGINLEVGINLGEDISPEVDIGLEEEDKPEEVAACTRSLGALLYHLACELCRLQGLRLGPAHI